MKIGEQNFFDIEGSPFGFFSLNTDHFQINAGGKGSGGGCCHSKITIKIGLYFDFHMVPSLPARPQFLAMLTAKKSNVPPPTSFTH